MARLMEGQNPFPVFLINAILTLGERVEGSAISQPLGGRKKHSVREAVSDAFPIVVECCLATRGKVARRHRAAMNSVPISQNGRRCGSVQLCSGGEQRPKSQYLLQARLP